MKNILLIFLLSITITATAQNKFRQPVNMYDTLRLFKGASPGKILQCVTDSGSCAWVNASSSVDTSNFWNLNGNSVSNSNFIGTTNNNILQLKANNIFGMLVDTFGSVSICDSAAQDIDFTDSLNGYYKFRSFAYRSPYISKLQQSHNKYSILMGNENNPLQAIEYAIAYTDTSSEVAARIYDDSLFYQNGIFYYTNGVDSTTTARSPQISIYNTNSGNDIVSVATRYNPTRKLGVFQIHVDDSLFNSHELHFQNMEFIPDDSIWNLGSQNHLWRNTYTYGLTIPTNAAVSKMLTSDASGNATWEATAQSNGTYTTPALAAAALGSGKPYILSTTIGAVAVLLQAITP